MADTLLKWKAYLLEQAKSHSFLADALRGGEGFLDRARTVERQYQELMDTPVPRALYAREDLEEFGETFDTHIGTFISSVEGLTGAQQSCSRQLLRECVTGDAPWNYLNRYLAGDGLRNLAELSSTLDRMVTLCFPGELLACSRERFLTQYHRLPETERIYLDNELERMLLDGALDLDLAELRELLR